MRPAARLTQRLCPAFNLHLTRCASVQIGAAGGRCGCVVGVCAPTPMLHLLLLLLLLLVVVLVLVVVAVGRAWDHIWDDR